MKKAGHVVRLLSWLGRWFLKITFSGSIAEIDKDIEDMKSILADNDEQKASEI